LAWTSGVTRFAGAPLTGSTVIVAPRASGDRPPQHTAIEKAKCQGPPAGWHVLEPVPAGRVGAGSHFSRIGDQLD